MTRTINSTDYYDSVVLLLISIRNLIIHHRGVVLLLVMVRPFHSLIHRCHDDCFVAIMLLVIVLVDDPIVVVVHVVVVVVILLLQLQWWWWWWWLSTTMIETPLLTSFVISSLAFRPEMFRHAQRVHTVEGPSLLGVCTYCWKVFGTIKRMRLHQRMVHAELSMCEQCGVLMPVRAFRGGEIRTKFFL